MQLYRLLLIHLLKSTIAQDRGALIGGGIEASIEHFPWQAFIGFADVSFCGGSIISSRYVMTAAHCCDDPEPPDVIIFGASNVTGWRGLPENLTITSALKCINHPNYTSNGYWNDIALVLVKNRIEFSKTIRPIHLPFTNIENLESFRSYVAGYGNDLGGSSGKHLYYIFVEILSDKACEDYVSSYHRASKICLRGENGKGVCFGDSGGSLIIHYKNIPIAVGIVSYASGTIACFNEYTTEVFTRVNYFLPWIINVTSEKIND